MPSTSSIPAAMRADPKQSRSERTVELILTAAAALLAEVGFEKLTTNEVCKRAGLTPPALYRYFPNKYAVLKELGEQLMIAQNAALHDWIAESFNEENLQGSIADLLRVTIDVTHSQPAGARIMRSMHASPVLADVRLQSHRAVSEDLTDWICEKWKKTDRMAILHLMRLSVEIGYAIVEMIFDEAEINTTKVITDTADLIAVNFRKAIDKT